jgi:hypothetical protein
MINGMSAFGPILNGFRAKIKNGRKKSHSLSIFIKSLYPPVIPDKALWIAVQILYRSKRFQTMETHDL